ncbi:MULTISPECIES: hypothetical protein [Paenibacillus]|uniref:hypothetical protein n=1 Tax=Paenibacillus TaxID=44249 RepID=UPI00105A5AEF|nr:hypothetical protein [Paenibacillus amylolyticus]TDL70128.1 hypothetical protein E2R58_13540 [Paenibacillus amylolyticus]UOK62064.1 hypothetical protein MT997_27435 [Paenibacillus sp. OVF10]
MLGKYIGQMVELVYMDREGQITQRQIRINSVRGGMIRASAGKEGSPRTFLEQGILAWRPVKDLNGEVKYVERF